MISPHYLIYFVTGQNKLNNIQMIHSLVERKGSTKNI